MVARRTAHQSLPGLVFGVPLCVYLLTLAPDLTWAHYGADGGDLVTAAYTLGVPHPPGYPVYTLLAWLFTRLPWGAIAWRVNLLSAVSTAGTTVLIYWVVVSLADRHRPARTQKRTVRAKNDPRKDQAHDITSEPPSAAIVVSGLGAAWIFAFAPLVWGQALIAEVYGLSGFGTALILRLALSLRRSQRDAGAFYALGLVWSLSLGIHLTLILLAPVIVWAVWGAAGFARRRLVLKRCSFVTLGFLTGLLIWLYLPLRAGRGGVTWGEPTTWDGLRWMVSAALYQDYVFALPVADLGKRLAAWAQAWVSGLGIFGVGLATIGINLLYERRRSWLTATGLSFVLLNLYALGYDTADSVVYLVPAFVVGSIWLGVGLTQLVGQIHLLIKDRAALVVLTMVMALMTPAWLVLRNGATLNLRDDRTARSFCEAVMRDAPVDAILLTTADRQTFALWYCQHVEGLRSDVAVVDEGLREFEWYRAGLQKAHPDLWNGRSEAAVPMDLTDKRPHCYTRREGRPGWLDCQSSKTDGEQ